MERGDLADEPGVVDDKCGTATWDGTPCIDGSDLDTEEAGAAAGMAVPGEDFINREFSRVKKSLAASWDCPNSSKSRSLTPAGKFWFLFFLSFSATMKGNAGYQLE